jgi:aldehyde:ferredoxin oxidoreductase
MAASGAAGVLVMGLPTRAARRAASAIQKLRWQTRIATGFAPEAVTIPKRFSQVTTWKGPIDPAYLDALKTAYGQAIVQLAHQ